MSGLSLEQISHCFGDQRVVDDVSIDILPGEIMALLGPSGCGKSTTLRIAAGLERVQAGAVRIGGTLVAAPTTHVPPEGRSTGLVLQDFALFPHLRVIENVAFGMRRDPPERALDKAMAWLEKLDIARYAQAWPHQLSGGEQQRVALARALAPNPAVMLMDEPFSSLDVSLRDKVRDDTLAILKDANVPTLLVTHDPEEAMRLADKIAVMRSGRLIQTGTPDEIYNHPVRAFVMRLFGDTNAFAGMVRNGGIETPMGMVPADGLADGEPVVIMARSHDFEVMRDNGGVPARILRSRLLGADRLLDVQLGGANAAMAIKLPGHHEYRAGETIHIRLNLEKTFIFPHKPDNSRTERRRGSESER